MKKYIVLYVLFLFMGVSCDSYLDINDSPNGATEPPISGLLSNVTYNSAMNVYRYGYYTSYYVQYTASSSKGSLTDTQRRISLGNAWSGTYGISGDIYDMIAFAEEAEASEYIGAGKVLMALNMGLAVDAFGDIPYSEAFDFSTITPKYDDDKEIYTVIFNLLDEGISELKKDSDALALDNSSDFLHGGDKDAWIKTAYGLKARFLNHLSKTGQYDPDAVLTALSNSYTSNADDAELSNFQTRNPWNQVARDNENLLLDGWLSEHFMRALNGKTFGIFDPRLPLITQPTPEGEYIGTPNGAGRRGDGTTQEEVYVTTTGFYSSEKSPLVVLSYSELKFIEAEALFRKGDKPGAYEAYKDGIRANMEKMGVDEGDIDNYMSHSSVEVGLTNFSLETLFKEKHIALYLQPESWVDARRIDYKYKDMEVPEGLNPDLQGQFIRRLDYPDSEYQRNAAGMPEVKLSDRLWWDQ